MMGPANDEATTVHLLANTFTRSPNQTNHDPRLLRDQARPQSFPTNISCLDGQPEMEHIEHGSHRVHQLRQQDTRVYWCK